MNKDRKETKKDTDANSRTEALPVWLHQTENGVIVCIRVQPGAKRDAVVGLYDGKLKIALTAPPVDGKANAALQAFLSKKSKTAKSDIEIIAGQTSRSKRLLIKNAAAQKIAAALS